MFEVPTSVVLTAPASCSNHAGGRRRAAGLRLAGLVCNTDFTAAALSYE
jgi:hypothetical protein